MKGKVNWYKDPRPVVKPLKERGTTNLGLPVTGKDDSVTDTHATRGNDTQGSSKGVSKLTRHSKNLPMTNNKRAGFKSPCIFDN